MEIENIVRRSKVRFGLTLRSKTGGTPSGPGLRNALAQFLLS